MGSSFIHLIRTDSDEFFLMAWVIFHCVYVPQLPYPFVCWWASRLLKIWNASRICVSSLCRGHANLLCIISILVYVLPKQAPEEHFWNSNMCSNPGQMNQNHWELDSGVNILNFNLPTVSNMQLQLTLHPWFWVRYIVVSKQTHLLTLLFTHSL